MKINKGVETKQSALRKTTETHQSFYKTNKETHNIAENKTTGVTRKQ